MNCFCEKNDYDWRSRRREQEELMNVVFTASAEQEIFIGKGLVDPFKEYVDDENISSSSIIVRACILKNEEYLCSRFPKVFESPKSPFIWKKSEIQRCALLGEFNDAISAALVAGQPKTCSIYEKRIAELNSMHLGNAVAVCDVSIYENSRRRKYAFQEWYGETTYFINMRVDHFSDSIVPSHLEDIGSTCVALLWHKSRMRPSQ